MAIQVLGKIPVVTPGTLVQISVTTIRASWFTITPNPTNTGNIYIGNKNMVRATGVGVLAVIQKTGNPFQIFTNGNGIDPEDLWLDADNANDFAYVGIAS